MNWTKSALIRVVAPLVVASLACACTEWHSIPRAANGSYPTDRLARAKITLVNGSSMRVNEVRVRADSVVGTDPATAGRAAFSVREISRIDSQEYSRFRTLTLVGSLVGTFLGIDLFTVRHR